MTCVERLFDEVDKLSLKYNGTVWRNLKQGDYYVIDVFGIAHNEFDVTVGYRSTSNNNLWFTTFDKFNEEFERVVY